MTSSPVCDGNTRQKRDYVLDTKTDFVYVLHVSYFFTFALCFFTSALTCFTILGWKRCFRVSSVVMSFGCFFFGMESFQ